ncbi:MAG: ABC transporter permease [Patescibacteria group bacterium]
MNIHRIFAVLLRHWYNFTHNLDRIVDAFYWPSVDIVLWGLTISALQKQGQVMVQQVYVLVFSVILWNIVWRAQGEITVNLLEELWSENITNLFASPLKVTEWMVGLSLMSLFKLTLTVLLTSAISLLMYSANITSLGIMLVPMMVTLMLMGWAFGFFVAGLFLRHGTSVQTLAWAGAFILMPFSAVYYPLFTLPLWVQKVALFLPSSYIFEGLRTLMQTGVFPMQSLLYSNVLNAIYLSLAILYFFRSFEKAREKGLGHLK